MNQTVLITGASSGIGYELCKIFAQNRYRIILVARNEQKLLGMQEQLQAKYGVPVIVMVKDLSQKNTAEEIYNDLQEQQLTVDILVNNAGFGDYGAFSSSDWKKQAEMVEVNIVALMHLTRLLLPQMIDRKTGKVLNIASIAAFEPGPFMSVYYATKAFVLSFSEALGCELKNSGVSVTAVCPGPTKTGFESAAGEGTDKLFSKIKNSTAEEVALYSYHALMRNKPVAIHGMMNRFMVWGQRFLPRSVVRNLVYKIQK